MIALGIDSGGSNTRLAFLDSKGEVQVLRGARGNVAERGPGPVCRTITSLVKKALPKMDGGNSLLKLSGSLVVGAAGVGTAGLQDALAEKLASALPKINLRLVTDAELAMYTAFGQKPGIAIIVGTGTAMFMRTSDGSLKSGGGWGPLAGDIGGGFWLGRHLLSHVADVYDGLAERDWVVQRFLEQEGIGSRASFKAWLREAARKRKAVAAIAPIVIEALARSEGWACWLCSQAASSLGRLAQSMAKEVGRSGDIYAVLVGGVVEGKSEGQVKYRQVVAQRCHQEANIRVIELPHRPVEGALYWAKELEQAKGRQ